MGLSDLQLNTFKDLFSGNKHNYGQHVYAFAEKGEKEKGGNHTVTNKLLTLAQYRAHLDGKKGLGIVPITSDNKCKFAVIDIDVYNQDFSPYVRAIERLNMPIVPFLSKSGGFHLYVFFKTFVKAKDAVAKLKQLSRILGITLFVKQHKNEAVEIFPKQLKLAEGQAGSWLNLPYFNGDESTQTVLKNGEPLALNDALTHIKTKLTSIEELDELIADLPFGDAPPCLQTLYILNHLGESNGRNNYLFSFAVYLKKKDENYFEQAVSEINQNLPVPIDTKRLEETVLSSVRKKDYSYKCTAGPICDFCDKKICKTKEYGIGQEGGYFTNLIFGAMMQYQAASPYYEWEVKGQDVAEFKSLRFKNEDEIIKQDVFLRLCFRELHFLPFKMKQAEWFKLVNQALNELKLVDVDRADDTSPLVRFHNMLFDFLTARSLADTKDQLIAGRVYFDKDKLRYNFRTKDLTDYLYDFKNFRAFSSGEIHGLLGDLGVRRTVVRSESGRQIRVNQLHRDKVTQEYMSSKEQYEVDFEPYQEDEQF